MKEQVITEALTNAWSWGMGILPWLYQSHAQWRLAVGTWGDWNDASTQTQEQDHGMQRSTPCLSHNLCLCMLSFVGLPVSFATVELKQHKIHFVPWSRGRCGDQQIRHKRQQKYHPSSLHTAQHHCVCICDYIPHAAANTNNMMRKVSLYNWK